MKNNGGSRPARLAASPVLWRHGNCPARARRTTYRQAKLRLLGLGTRGCHYLRGLDRALGRTTAVCVAVAIGVALALRHVQIAKSSGMGASVQTLDVALPLTCALVALLRFSSYRRARDLGIFAAALSLATMTLALAALPDALHVPRLDSVGTGVVSDLLFAAVFTWVALMPPDRLMADARFWIAAAFASAMSLVGVAELLGALLSWGAGAWPDRVGAAGHYGSPVVAVISLSVLLQAIAGTGFARWRSAPGGAGSEALVLAACAFGAASISRLGAHTWAAEALLVTLAGAAMTYAAVKGEFAARRREGAAHALAERQRVARDLHDGLAQDLAFIVANTPALERTMGAGHPVAVAASRALAVSRSTIADLSGPICGDTRLCLEAVGLELQDRFGISISTEVTTDRNLDDYTREHVSRIVYEAVTNAVRHGGAQHVLVWLSPHVPGVCLRVWDDGRSGGPGDPEPHAEGFGMRSMRERVTSLGGSFSVSRPRTGGTRVECVLP